MKAQQGIEDNSEVPDDIIKKVILGELVSNALLVSSAEDLKIKASDKEINDKINEIKRIYEFVLIFLFYVMFFSQKSGNISSIYYMIFLSYKRK